MYGISNKIHRDGDSFSKFSGESFVDGVVSGYLEEFLVVYGSPQLPPDLLGLQNGFRRQLNRVSRLGGKRLVRIKIWRRDLSSNCVVCNAVSNPGMTTFILFSPCGIYMVRTYVYFNRDIIEELKAKRRKVRETLLYLLHALPKQSKGKPTNLHPLRCSWQDTKCSTHRFVFLQILLARGSLCVPQSPLV